MTINWTNNSILSKRRKGTPDDPFILIEESLQCINGKTLLTEIPNKFNKVIVNYSEEYSNDKDYKIGDLVCCTVNNEKQTYECISPCKNIDPTDTSYWVRIHFVEKQNNEILNKYEYYVDYLHGVVIHHPYFSNHNLIYKYYGEGATYYPASRVWTKADGNKVVETLQSLIDSGRDAIDAVSNLQPKIDEAYILKENLEEDINTGNILHANLENTISISGELHDILQSDISIANVINDDLKNTIDNANISKENLNEIITDVDIIKTNLNNTISSGNLLKSQLNASIDLGNNLHSDLQEDMNIGNILKDRIENTTIPNAEVTKINLETTISNADVIKDSLSTTINTANVTKNNLDNSIITGETIKSNLNTTINEANNINSILSDPTDGTIKQANDINVELNDTIINARTVDNDLNKTINDGQQINSALNSTINNAELTKNNLNNVISSGENTKLNLENIISNANTTKSVLENNISIATQKNADLNISIDNADLKNIELNNTINSAGTLINDISNAMDNANISKQELNSTIENAQNINSELNTTIINAHDAKNELETKIIEADLDQYISITQIGVPNGVASLDENGLVHSSQLSIKQALKVVNNITERDNLEDKYEGMKVHVVDASDDETVDSGWAEYLWTGIYWKKVAEKESLDIILDWHNVENKPTQFSPLPHTHNSNEVTGLSTVATSGNYNDLINKPNIPTKTSQLINDSDFVTNTFVNNKLADKQDKLNYIPENIENKGQANGYASLDADAKVPLSQLPEIQGMETHGNEYHDKEFITIEEAPLASIITQNFIAVEDETSEIDISISFSQATDYLKVYYENILLIENENYILNENGESITLLNWSIDQGDTIRFEVLKKVANVENLVSGSQLDDDSIEERKLSVGLKGKIGGTIDGLNELSSDFNLHLADYATTINDLKNTRGYANADGLYLSTVSSANDLIETGVYKVSSVNTSDLPAASSVFTAQIEVYKNSASVIMQRLTVVYDGTDVPAENEGRIYTRQKSFSQEGWTNWIRLDGEAEPTANRPTSVKIGHMCFDTTLGKPIWWNGINWVDANGITV